MFIQNSLRCAGGCQQPFTTERFYGQRKQRQERKEEAEKGKTEATAGDTKVKDRVRVAKSRVLVFVGESNVVSGA